MNAPLEALLEQLSERIAERILEQLRSELTQQNDNSSPWLDIKAAAAYLDWPRHRLYKLTAQGAIPHYKQDGRLLFNRPELDHWLRQYAQPSPTG